jgi:hypothetical protein
MGQASDGILIEAQKLTRIYSVGSAGVVGIQDIDLAIPRGELVVVKGESLHLEKMDFSLQILDHWKSPHTGAVYPSLWGIQVYRVDLDLSISSNLEARNWLLERPHRLPIGKAVFQFPGKPEDMISTVWAMLK